MLEEAHVAMVPGSSFTDMGKGYIRISYAYDMDVLKRGYASIRKILKSKLQYITLIKRTLKIVVNCQSVYHYLSVLKLYIFILPLLIYGNLGIDRSLDHVFL